MSFSFYGSAVSILGSKRPNHGNYHVELDDQVFPQVNGASTDIFNQTLFTAQGLSLGFHNISITNDDNGRFLDVDYVSFDTVVGQPSESLIVNTYKDNHPSFAYQPSTSWGPPPLVGYFMGSTGHATTDASAMATFTFQGNAIGLYGSVGPNNTEAYSVKVDNGPLTILTAQRTSFKPQQLLFWDGNLSSGIHTLMIQSQSVSGSLAIDYANVYTTKSLGGSFGATVAIKAESGPSPGLVAGLVMTTILAVFSTLAFIWLFLRQRRSRRVIEIPNEKPKRASSVFIQPYAIQQVEPSSGWNSNLSYARSFPPAPTSQVSMSSIPSDSVDPTEDGSIRQIYRGPSSSAGGHLDTSNSSNPRGVNNPFNPLGISPKRLIELKYEAEERGDLPPVPMSTSTINSPQPLAMRTMNRFQVANVTEYSTPSAASFVESDNLPPPEYSRG